MEERICIYCQATFMALRENVRRGWGLYCSRSCLARDKFQAANKRSHDEAIGRQIILEQPSSHRLIKLGRGTAMVSIDDYERVMNHAWHVTKNGYASAMIGGKLVTLHRFIMDARPGQMIDHVSGDRLDNRRSNLRFATQQQNAVNSRTCRSGYKGVARSGKKWVASVAPNRTYIHIGSFDTEVEAAYMYDQFALAVYGEYARLNFEYV